MAFKASLRTRLLTAISAKLYELAGRFGASAGAARTRDLESYADYLHDKCDHRVAQAEALEAGISRTERNLTWVQQELGLVKRPPVPPFNEVQPFGPQDFDDLPNPLDEDEAPVGYKAVLSAPERGCSGCAFDPTAECPMYSGAAGCTAMSREDDCDVVFVRR